MFDRKTAQALSDRLSEPAYVREQRIACFEQLSALGQVDPLPATPEPMPAPVIECHEEDRAGFDRIGIRLFADGTKGTDDAGMRETFATLVSPGDSPEALRHYAGLTGLLCIVVPSDLVLRHPLRVHWHATHAWSSTHTLIVLGRGARATVAEELTGGQDGRWSHAVEAAVTAPEASLTYSQLQHAHSGAELWMAQQGALGPGSAIHWNIATLGGKSVRQHLVSLSAGPHARSDINWLFYARAKEAYDLSCRNVFAAADGEGEILLRGVAEGQAHVSCRGMIDIGLRGRGTDTYLTQEVLMLDASARVDAVPALEIKTNDVKASHSATVARVTEEDLFYFAARGIAEQEARKMFVAGFLADLVQEIDPAAQERVTAAISRKYLQE